MLKYEAFSSGHKQRCKSIAFISYTRAQLPIKPYMCGIMAAVQGELHMRYAVPTCRPFTMVPFSKPLQMTPLSRTGSPSVPTITPASAQQPDLGPLYRQFLPCATNHSDASIA